MAGPGANEYLQDKNVSELFQSLTVGLLYHRPDDHVSYLLQCLDQLKSAPSARQAVFWDTFLPSDDRRPSRLAVIPNTSPPSNKSHDDITSKSRNQLEKIPEGRGIEKQGTSNDDPTSAGVPRITTESAEVSLDNNESRFDNSGLGNASRSNGHLHPLQKKNQDGMQLNVAESVSLRPLSPFDKASSVDENEDTRGAVSASDDQVLIADKATMEIIRGSLDNLPSMPRHSVRIFLSSTFSDFKAERNFLPRHAYPELQEYCSTVGLDFQVVDMRWGVTDELQNDHQVSELCVREIATCQQVSFGPNFVSLLGNRYGYRPFPAMVDETEFGLLSGVASEGDTEAASLLAEWYRKDENYNPPTYVLQPIDSKLKFYSDLSEENAAFRKQQLAEWNSISNTLQKTLTLAAQELSKRRLISDETLSKYLISVTEEEIKQGMLTAANPSSTALCYRRDLLGLNSDRENVKVGKFIDVAGNQSLDQEAQELLQKLRDEKIPSVLGKDRIANYSVPWKQQPLEESEDPEHIEYLQQFADRFVNDMKVLIQARLEDELGEALYMKDLYLEVLHHAKFAVLKSSIFCGREDALDRIRNYLSQPEAPVQPFIIGGSSGLGKTALLAYVARSLPQWLSHESIVVLRFFGTSPASSNILHALRSIINQICLSFGYTPPADSALEKMSQVRRYLWSLLDRISDVQTSSKLVLLLDSADQLSMKYGSHNMTWLPRKLPENVYIIVTMLSDRYECLQRTKDRIDNPNNIIELPQLSVTAGDTIINSYFDYYGKCINKEQRQLIMDTFTNSRQPLFLRLVLDIALKWHSYTPVEGLILPTSVQEAIGELFKRQESKFGVVFVSHALGYLTCGRGGLTQLEMEDILSCDDDVLNEVYKYHDPPLEGSIRIPPLMWARLENELRDYLVERMVDGKTVLTWYHRQFWEAATKRYLQDQEIILKHQFALSELYSQEKGIHRTITLTQRKGKVIENADRKVNPQHLDVINVRKLNCLPHHLFKSEQREKLKARCLLDFEWMYTKINALGIAEVFTEYAAYAESDLLKGDEDIRLFSQFLELCYDAIKIDPNLFASHIIERLKYYADSQAIHQLLEDSKAMIGKSKDPMLLPTHDLQLLGLDSPLRFSLIAGGYGVFTPNKEHAVCVWDERHAHLSKIQVVSLEAKDVITTIHLDKVTPVCTSTDGRLFYYVRDNTVHGVECETGDPMVAIDYLPDTFDKYTPRCITASDDGRYIAAGTKTGRPKNVGQSAWKQGSVIALFDCATMSHGPVAVYNLRGKRHVDEMLFVDDNTKLLVVTREKIYMLSLPDLEVDHDRKYKEAIYGKVSHHLTECNSVAFGLKCDIGVKINIFDYKENQARFSSLVHDTVKEPDTVEPFSTVGKLDGSFIILGACQSSKNVRSTRLWLWDVASDENEADDSHITEIAVGLKDWKHGICLCVNQAWTHLYVGWSNGDISMVDLLLENELYNVHAHGNSVNMITMLDEDASMVTMGTDQSLKVWTCQTLHSKSHMYSNDDTKESDEKRFASLDEIQPVEEKMLGADEQCLGILCTDGYLITAPHLNRMAPQFWHVKDGSLDVKLTKTHEHMYQKAYVDGSFNYEARRTHAVIEMVGNYLVYKRQRRSLLTLFIVEGISSPKFIAYEHFNAPACFFNLFTLKKIPGLYVDGPFVILVRDGAVEIRDIKLALLRSIEIPLISKAVGNLESSAAKRRLLLYRSMLTDDGRFFCLASTYGQKGTGSEVRPGGGKYLDIIDLEGSMYVRRMTLPTTTSVFILTDAFYFLHISANDDRNSGLFAPSRLPPAEEGQYRCLVHGEIPLLSPDESLGTEPTRGNGIRVWRLNPLEKIQQLRGHSSVITSSRFSLDNKLVVSTSKDTTVRVWRITTGEQLSVFSLYGAMEIALFTPSTEYVVVHCYSAKQRKRAAIFRLHNVHEEQ